MNWYSRFTRAASRLSGAVVFSFLAALIAPTAGSAPAPAFVPGEVLVQFRPGATAAEQAGALPGDGAVVRNRVHTAAMRASGAPGLAVASTAGSVENAVRALRGNPAVLHAEPNWLYTTQEVSNDPYYTNGSLWGMYGATTSPANQYGSGAGIAWSNNFTGSGDVVIGIIDTGVQVTHPDLAPNVWVNPADPVDGIDNDGNGYVDDVNGWDFYQDNNTPYDGRKDEHGTHVAGTIGARGGNGAGVAGVCWNVKLISAKFIGPVSGSTADAIEAVDYLTDLKKNHNVNIVAINNSWGGGGYSQFLLDAIVRAAKANILFVAAAGNDGVDTDSSPHYPSSYNTTAGAGYNSVVSVAALASNGSMPYWSNYGKSSVHLGAPGSGIYSTVPENSYKSLSGTSMATPHVTGAVALYASQHTGASAQSIRQAVLGAVTATSSLSLRTTTGGRLNVGALMGTAPPDPDPTHDVAVVSVTSPASVTQGETGTVSVVVSNAGSVSETFTVSGADTPPSGGTAGTVSSAVVTLASGSTASVNLTWNTAGASVGAHTLTVTAGPVPGESSVGNNSAQAVSQVTAPEPVVPVPQVTAIAPSSMTFGGTAQVTVTGANFAPGATLTFNNGTYGPPTATVLSVSPDGASLTASVTSSPSGSVKDKKWDVVVTNPDGRSGRLTNGFTVNR